MEMFSTFTDRTANKLFLPQQTVTNVPIFLSSTKSRCLGLKLKLYAIQDLALHGSGRRFLAAFTPQNLSRLRLSAHRKFSRYSAEGNNSERT
jgi:hypothetical protein